MVKDLFASDKERFNKYSLKFKGEDGGIIFDYSKNLIDDKSHALLLELALEANVYGLRDRLFAGEHINTTEDRFSQPNQAQLTCVELYTILHCAMSVDNP